MNKAVLLSACLVALANSAAANDFKPITDAASFKSLVAGKTLSRPLIKLVVSADGQISGRGAAWDVTGTWTWKSGFFCRELFWGGSEIGYNCQQVATDGENIRFQSDKGTGDYADFKVRE